MMDAKVQLLRAIEERSAAEQAHKLASNRLHEANATVWKLSNDLAEEALGDKRGKKNAVVINLGNELGLWCVWESRHQEPSTQIVEVKE